MKKLLLITICLITVLFSVCFMGGCEVAKMPSADRTKYTYSYSQCECSYKQSTNTTTIAFNFSATNDTMYGINYVVATYEYYRDGNLLETQTLELLVFVEPCESIDKPLVVKCQERVDNASVQIEKVHLQSFWDVFGGWIITLLILTAAAICVMAYTINYNSMDLEETLPLMLWAAGITAFISLFTILIYGNWMLAIIFMLAMVLFNVASGYLSVALS